MQRMRPPRGRPGRAHPDAGEGFQSGPLLLRLDAACLNDFGPARDFGFYQRGGSIDRDPGAFCEPGDAIALIAYVLGERGGRLWLRGGPLLAQQFAHLG